MAVMDEFKEQREAIKNAPLKKKWEYFLDYYKWPTIITIVLVIAAISYIVHLVTMPETLMSGFMLNLYSLEDPTTELMTDFLESQQLDPSDYTVDLNSGLSYTPTADDSGVYEDTTGQAIQLIYAQAVGGTLDFITGDDVAMTDLAYRGLLGDLRDFLSETQLEKYEPHFLYMDMAVYEKIEAAVDAMESTDEIMIPDCRKPEEMEDPIPVMIDMGSSEKIRNVYSYNADTPVFSVAASCKKIDLTCTLLDYFMSE